LCRPEANIRPPRLEILEAPARRDFQPLLRPGRPRLQIDLVGGGKSEITRCELHLSIGQVERA
jgi:hypothetical protein